MPPVDSVRAMDTPAETPTVRHDPDRQRYEVLLGDEVVGFADHHPGPGSVEVFPHTVVDEAHRDKGLASVLVRHAMDEMREQGRQVEPACWYVAHWLRRHPEYQDLLAPQ
ncbi:MAG: hypothetical protein JWM47_417 [Acidimicrobiales bacterium]|nr:hypothetical protein [Acidimicrobiales bacterium]